VLVHCVAGVGRTGCVLLLSNCVECIEEQLAGVKTLQDAELSVMSILLELRKNRVFIVERTWQYESVYAAVVEIVKLGILP
jgi:protein tyrosine phosphatase